MSISFENPRRITAPLLPALTARWGAWWQSHLLIGVVVWAVSIGWIASRADQGWIPHDSGTIAQGAERVLAGELPHRDFDTPYTGGLEFVNALAFKLFGVRMIATRWLMLIVVAAFVPALYAIAARVCPPWAAGLVTWVAVAWSLPNYFTALPSWYNLFCATFGAWALLRYVDTSRRRWLVIAGIAGGVSCLFKSVGLYYIAAAGLFLLYREQSHASDAPPSRRSTVHVGATLLALATFATMLLALVTYHPAFMELLHFALPGLLLTAFLAGNEVLLWKQNAPARTASLAMSLGCLTLGVALPLVVYLAPFAFSGSLHELWRGVVVLPARRLQDAVVPLPAVWTLLGAVPLALLLAAPWLIRTVRSLQSIDSHEASLRTRRGHKGRCRPPVDPTVQQAQRATVYIGLGLAALVLVGMLVAGGQREIFAGAWGSARAAIPLAVAAGCFVLWRTPRGELSGSRRQELFLVLAMAALVSLVQVPLAHAIYFCYAAPLAALAVLFVVRSQRPAVPRAALILVVFYLLFPLVWLRDAMPHAFGSHYVRLEQSTPMELERSGLRVDPVAAPMYRDLVAEVRRRSADNAYIFAGPDCPEVYFLSGKRNPTRTFFDLFDTDYGTPAREERILRLLDKRQIKVVVLKHLVEVSKRGQRRLTSRLSEAFPHQKTFNVAGQTVFSVLWRDDVAQPPRSLAVSRSAPLLGSR